MKKEPFRHANIYTYSIVRLFKWFLFGENQKIIILKGVYINKTYMGLIK